MSKINYAIAGLSKGRVESGSYVPYAVVYNGQDGSERFVSGLIMYNETTKKILSPDTVRITASVGGSSVDVHFIIIDPSVLIDDNVIANSEAELSKYDEEIGKLRQLMLSYEDRHSSKTFVAMYEKRLKEEFDQNARRYEEYVKNSANDNQTTAVS